MECRTLNKSRIAKNSRDGKSNAINKQTDEFHTTFPNFMILTEEERREFFQTLYSAKLKLEQNGVTVLPQFGTVHDQSWNDSKNLETIEEKSTDCVNSSEEEICNSEDNLQEGFKSHSGNDVFSWNRITREECYRDNVHIGCFSQHVETESQMDDFTQNSPRCCPSGSHEKVNKVKALLEAYKNESPRIPESKFIVPQCRFFNVSCCNEKMSAEQLNRQRRDDVLKIKGKNLKVQVTVSSVENEKMKKTKSAKGMYRSEMNNRFLDSSGYVGYSARRSGAVCFNEDNLETFSEPLEYSNMPPFEGDICDSGIRSFTCVKMEDKETMVNAPDKCLLTTNFNNNNCDQKDMVNKSTQTDSRELETGETTQVEKVDKGVGSGEVLFEPEVKERPEAEREGEGEEIIEKTEIEKEIVVQKSEDLDEDEVKKKPKKSLFDDEDEDEEANKPFSDELDDPELKDLLNVDLDEGDMETQPKKKKGKRGGKSPVRKRSAKSVSRTATDTGNAEGAGKGKSKGIPKKKSSKIKRRAETETKITNPFVVQDEPKSDNPFLTDEIEACKKLLRHTDSKVLARKNLAEPNQNYEKKPYPSEEGVIEPKYSPALMDQRILGDVQKGNICRRPDSEKTIRPRRTETLEKYIRDFDEMTSGGSVLSVDNQLLQCGKRSVGIQVEKKAQSTDINEDSQKLMRDEECQEYNFPEMEEDEERRSQKRCCFGGEVRELGKPQMMDACVGDEFDIKVCGKIEEDDKSCGCEEEGRADDWGRRDPQGPPLSGKVVFVDDNVIDKIRDVITDLERKTKSGEKCQLENEYVGLLLDHLDYLTTILMNAFDNQKPGPKLEDEMGNKDLKEEEPEKPEESPKVPPSTSEEESEQELESQYSQSTEEKKDPEKEEEEEKEDEGTPDKKTKKGNAKEKFRWIKRIFRIKRTRKNLRFKK